jgi:hypothetical protein
VSCSASVDRPFSNLPPQKSCILSEAAFGTGSAEVFRQAKTGSQNAVGKRVLKADVFFRSNITNIRKSSDRELQAV